MKLTAVDIITTVCPALAGSPSMPQYVAMAKESVNGGFFGSMKEYAYAYYAAHLYTVTGDEGVAGSVAGLGGGAVSGMSEGGLSIQFAVPDQAGDGSGLNSTKYGRLFLSLKKSRVRFGVNASPFLCHMAGGGCL